MREYYVREYQVRDYYWCGITTDAALLDDTATIGRRIVKNHCNGSCGSEIIKGHVRLQE